MYLVRLEREFVDEIGESAAEYRDRIYTSNFSGFKEHLDREKVINFLETAQQALEETIDTNKRKDGLYHAYNLVSLGVSMKSLLIDFLRCLKVRLES